MGGGRDTCTTWGSIVATGGSAIDMGAGNDQVYLSAPRDGSSTQFCSELAMTLLLVTSAGSFVIDGGDGNDSDLHVEHGARRQRHAQWRARR